MIYLNRSRLAILGVISLACVSVAFLFVFRTDWFQETLRSRALNSIRQATGTQATVGSLRFDIGTRTVELKHLVLRGSEPAGAAPLFEAPLIRVKVRIWPLLRGRLDIASVFVYRPALHLIVTPDGSTNLPSPPRHLNAGIYEQLLNLGIDHFELDHGFLRLNEEAVPFEAAGGSLKLIWTRRPTAIESKLSLKSTNLSVQYGNSLRRTFDIDLAAQLAPDRVDVSQLSLKAGASEVLVSGTVSHLSAPQARFRAKAQFAATDLARISGLSDLTGGRASFEGGVTYLPSSKISVRGALATDGLTYKSPSFTLRDVTVRSNLEASSAGDVHFSDLTITSPVGKLTGTAAIDQQRKLSLDGALAGVDIRKLAVAFAGKSVPWSGIGSGRITASAILDSAPRDLIARTNLTIQSVPGGIPLSGQLSASIAGTRKITFDTSHVNLPGTLIIFSGVPDRSLQLAIESSHLEDLSPLFSLAGFHYGANFIPTLGPDAGGSFHGSLNGPLTNPVVDGDLAIRRFQAARQDLGPDSGKDRIQRIRTHL